MPFPIPHFQTVPQTSEPPSRQASGADACRTRRAGVHAPARPKPRILIFQDFYLPGQKVGGPLWTIANMVERIGDRFEFLIAARDRDYMDPTPYSCIRRNAWNRCGKAQVFYGSDLSSRTIWRLIHQSLPDILHLNGSFSPSTVRTLLLRRLGLIPAIPTIVAPHGDLRPSAMSLKAVKKKTYLAPARSLGLYRHVIWQASNVPEENDIRNAVGLDADIHIACDMPSPAIDSASEPLPKPEKTPGQVRLVSLGRIARSKNLLFSLRMLQKVSGNVTLDILGPMEDRSYWEECREEIYKMPSPDRIHYRGAIAHEDVQKTLAQYHFLLLPSLGENFCYTILEALTVGCPVIISNRTPWRDLPAKRIGWDLPLNKLDSWEAVLREAAAMDSAAYASLSSSARRFALEWCRSPEIELQSVELFRRAYETHRAHAGSAAGTEARL
jgi:glycosyltransferase involved in cell wall biosynthesis